MTFTFPKNYVRKLVFLLVLYLPAFAQVDEYRLKAIFLERFTRFLTFPSDTNLNIPKEEFIIGVYGNHHFDTLLDEIYKSQTINDKNVTIQYINKKEDISDCDILYISKVVHKDIPNLLDQAKKNKIMTVSENNKYLMDKVFFYFYIKDNKIKFNVNPTIIIENGFKVDYRLLARK